MVLTNIERVATGLLMKIAINGKLPELRKTHDPVGVTLSCTGTFKLIKAEHDSIYTLEIVLGTQYWFHSGTLNVRVLLEENKKYTDTDDL